MSGTEKNPMEKKDEDCCKDVSMPLSQTEGNKSLKKNYMQKVYKCLIFTV